ncbi:MAG: single-strand selective monofunctional uracil DNA glycosylase [Myxococcota bacterium]|jgi:single-strand selective monofunctional uracil DNA glycosylase
MKLITISRQLADHCDQLNFPEPVTHIYNPLQYARVPHEKYLRKYARKNPSAILLGMNPGPWGMAQTGIPFGEIAAARDFLKVSGPVEQPPLLHPKRPITGFDCQRAEVSGRRLWGWVADRFESADAFADYYYVCNYCPLVFMEEGGRNFTPDKFKAATREKLFAICDEALRQTVDHLKPEYVIGIGKFAETRAAKALVDFDVKIATILHPSPASPMANRGWQPHIQQQLTALNLPN